MSDKALTTHLSTIKLHALRLNKYVKDQFIDALLYLILFLINLIFMKYVT